MSNANPPQSETSQPPVGIDLGTTYCVVAYLDPTGRPTTVLNGAGDLLTPSAILLDDDGIVIGKEAAKISAISPERYLDCFKRDMGSPAYRNKVVEVDVPPEVLSALMLERLKDDAERRLGTVSKAVITVPAFFDETRRKATQDAGRLAGLEVLDIINEPTAAAVAYGYQRGFFNDGADTNARETTRVLVYDLGGGTFDVTILEIQGTRFRALATDGDVRLGGRDFDERLVEMLADRFLSEHGVDPRSDIRDAAQLWLDAQEAKHALSERSKTTVVVHHNGIRMRIDVTRKEYEEITRDLLERTETTTSLVIKEAGLTWDQIDYLLLVGGSSRIPAVSVMLRRLSGKEPDRSLSPDEAVAHGAALYAGMLLQRDGESKSADCELVNVNSHSLGVVGIDVKTRRKVNAVLIPKNTRLPCRAVRDFQTARANQENVKIEIVEGESHRPSDCISIGKCVVRDLPRDLPKGTKVVVEYNYASNGRISVTAKIPSTRHTAHVEIAREIGKNLGDLADWKSRLLGLSGPLEESGEEERAEVEDASDPEMIRRRIDQVFMKIGRRSVKQEVPQSLSASRGAAHAALDDLKKAAKALEKADAELASASGMAEKIHLESKLAQARSEQRQLEKKSEFALLVLGRECVAHEFTPPGCEEDVEKVKQLSQRKPS